MSAGSADEADPQLGRALEVLKSSAYYDRLKRGAALDNGASTATP
jgi:hypothetical protein